MGQDTWTAFPALLPAGTVISGKSLNLSRACVPHLQTGRDPLCPFCLLVKDD